jgi:hypothetical protein
MTPRHYKTGLTGLGSCTPENPARRAHPKTIDAFTQGNL